MVLIFCEMRWAKFWILLVFCFFSVRFVIKIVGMIWMLSVIGFGHCKEANGTGSFLPLRSMSKNLAYIFLVFRRESVSFSEELRSKFVFQ